MIAATDDTKPAPKDVTRALAKYLVGARYEDLPANVLKEGVRTVNYVGVAIGGSHHQTVDVAVAALAPFATLSSLACSDDPTASIS